MRGNTAEGSRIYPVGGSLDATAGLRRTRLMPARGAPFGQFRPSLGFEEAGYAWNAPLGGDRHPEVGEGRRGGHPAPGGALEKPLLQEVRLVDVFHRLGLLADGDGQGRQAHRGPAEGPAEGGEDAPVDLVETPVVDLEQPERVPGHVAGDDAV